MRDLSSVRFGIKLLANHGMGAIRPERTNPDQLTPIFRIEENERTILCSLIQRVLAGLLVATFACTLARAQEALKIAIGQRGGWEQSVSELGQSKGFFKQHGLVLDVLYTIPLRAQRQGRAGR